jgi:hypothetical protein
MGTPSFPPITAGLTFNYTSRLWTVSLKYRIFSAILTLRSYSTKGGVSFAYAGNQQVHTGTQLT